MVLHGPSTAVSTTTVLFVLTTWSEHQYRILIVFKFFRRNFSGDRCPRIVAQQILVITPCH